MTDLTIGVPVFNGAQFLDECLANLAAQTFKDFVVLIYDNDSTDATGAIAQAWVARDTRFRHVRQPFNKGAAQNFLDVLHAAETPYFMWRADDDLCDANCVEKLMAMIVQPGIKLAACRIRSVRLDSGRERLTEVPLMGRPDSLADTARRLFRSHQSWFYGLWRREVLMAEFAAAWAAYPHLWGSDHLTLFPLLIDGSVAATNSTTFIQRIKTARPTSLPPQRPGLELMTGLRREFLQRCNGVLDARQMPFWRRRILGLMLIPYTSKRVYSLVKILKLRLRQRRSQG